MSDNPKIPGLSEVAVEAYQDVLKPSAREIGSTLGRVTKVALLPLNGALWTIERAIDYVSREVEGRLGGTPDDELTSPPPGILAGVLVGIRTAGDDELREMFANLLIASMTATTAAGAHPAFLESIRQLSPDEARVLKALARSSTWLRFNVIAREQFHYRPGPSTGLQVARSENEVIEVTWPHDFDLEDYDTARGAMAFRNLVRLGLLDSYPTKEIETLGSQEMVVEEGETSRTRRSRVNTVRTALMIKLSDWGRSFAAACIAETPSNRDRREPE